LGRRRIGRILCERKRVAITKERANGKKGEESEIKEQIKTKKGTKRTEYVDCWGCDESVPPRPIQHNPASVFDPRFPFLQDFKSDELVLFLAPSRRGSHRNRVREPCRQKHEGECSG
jgi:hypothetical protein